METTTKKWKTENTKKWKNDILRSISKQSGESWSDSSEEEKDGYGVKERPSAIDPGITVDADVPPAT